MSEIFHDLPFAEYLGREALSNSGLKLFSKSPAHYLAYLSQPQPDTPAMRFGRLVHTCVLEPDCAKLVVAPKVDKRTKAGKAEWEDFQNVNRGADIVTPEEMAAIQGMQDSISAHPAARALISAPGTAEASFFWQDWASLVDLRGRADFLRDDGIVVDLKTTEDASPAGFSRSIVKYNYHMQAALYEMGLRECGYDFQAFVFLVVEKTPPYAVACYTLAPVALDDARFKIAALLQKFKQCQDTDSWPAYSDQIETITLPAWALSQEVEQ